MSENTTEPNPDENSPSAGEGSASTQVMPVRRRWWFSTAKDEHPAASPTPGKFSRRRPWWLWLLGALVLALLVWIGVEQLRGGSSTSTPTLSGATSPSASTAPSGVPTVDPASVETALRYETMTTAGPVTTGCQLAVDPTTCVQTYEGSTSKFVSKPRVLSTAVLSGAAAQTGNVQPTGATGDRTVVLLTYTITATPTPQRWALLVRNSDHKVIGDQSIGSEQSGMTLAQVGQQIAEANQ